MKSESGPWIEGRGGIEQDHWWVFAVEFNDGGTTF